MRCYRAPLGTEIIREGDDGDFMVLILEGSVEIVKKDIRGQAQIMGTAGPGKTLGEMSLIDGEPRFASCVALEPVTSRCSIAKACRASSPKSRASASS